MLIRGPFNIKWGENTVSDVEEVDISHEISSDEFETIQGKTYEIDGPYKVSVTLTLLASDIPSVAALLPQHFVDNGGTLSTGETVNHAQGAIDVVPQECEESTVTNNLDILSCANPANVLRVVSARSKLEGFDLDGKLQKIMIKFVGESDADEATVQMFKEGTIATVS